MNNERRRHSLSLQANACRSFASIVFCIASLPTHMHDANRGEGKFFSKTKKKNHCRSCINRGKEWWSASRFSLRSRKQEITCLSSSSPFFTSIRDLCTHGSSLCAYAIRFVTHTISHASSNSSSSALSAVVFLFRFCSSSSVLMEVREKKKDREKDRERENSIAIDCQTSWLLE